MFVIKGSGIMRVGNETYPIIPGDLFAVNPDEVSLKKIDCALLLVTFKLK